MICLIEIKSRPSIQYRVEEMNWVGDNGSVVSVFRSMLNSRQLKTTQLYTALPPTLYVNTMQR